MPFIYSLSILSPYIKSFKIIKGLSNFVDSNPNDGEIIIDPKKVHQGISTHMIQVETMD